MPAGTAISQSSTPAVAQKVALEANVSIGGYCMDTTQTYVTTQIVADTEYNATIVSARDLRRIRKSSVAPLGLHPQSLRQRQGHPSIAQAINQGGHQLLVAIEAFGFNEAATHCKQQAVTGHHRQQRTGLKPDPQRREGSWSQRLREKLRTLLGKL